MSKLTIIVYWSKPFKVGNHGPIWVRNGLEKQKYDGKDPFCAGINQSKAQVLRRKKLNLKHDKNWFWK